MMLIFMVLSGLRVRKFGIQSVWVQHPQVTMLKACPNMTVAVE